MKLLNKMKSVLTLSFLLGLSSCTDAEIASVQELGTDVGTRALSMSVDGVTGNLNIVRPMEDKNVSMGEDDSWTIFVYLCGSDLESDRGRDGGYATRDLEEMFASAKSDKVRFVIQTGGADNWHVQNITATGSTRLLIENGWIKKVGQGPKLNMGASKTLSDFLTWGVENYPAEHMGVILWDHGGGSVEGLCYDETADDELLLRELETSFLNASRNMTDTFEFVGMDACLMSTIETANVLASYSDYMIASQESEAGEGWDYDAIGSYLTKNPDASGRDVGKVICDSFYKACEEEDCDDSCTISLIDLSKINQLLSSFNTFSRTLYDAATDSSVQSQMNKKITKIDYYGGRDSDRKYMNMVDFGGLVNACGDWSDKTETINALNDAVVYNLSGSDHTKASGLSIFYPLSTPSSEDMSVFETICVNPYYLSLVDRQVHGANYSYDDDTWFYDDTWSWQEDFFVVDDQYEYDNNGNSSYWGYLDDVETGESDLITFDEEPYVDDDGYFTFVLSEEGCDNATEVTGYVLQIMDNDDYVVLGETNDVDIDWDTGEVYDMFDGTWFSLADGQELSLYYSDYSDGADIYYSPALLNGQEVWLYIRDDYDGDTMIEGAYPMTESYAFSGRDMIEVKMGDTIIPMYYCLDDEDFTYKGDEYIVDDLEITYDDLVSADYLYSFIIYDVYGDYCFTDDIMITIDDDGEITVYE